MSLFKATLNLAGVLYLINLSLSLTLHPEKQDKILIGRSCESSEQCVGIPGITSVCTSSEWCTCLPGYIKSREKSDCLRIVNKLDEKCEETQQCQQGTPGRESECRVTQSSPTQKVCKCKRNAVNQPGQNICYLKSQYMEACRIQEQCMSYQYSAQCLNGKCVDIQITK
ncbi:unnamed protein product [Orchesella dallaii]|uniref:EB domain-containing protein n=1 Tax=Orchesella dallaii TaxID=48710 RepID=A0ABP1PSE5_9HEXA